MFLESECVTTTKEKIELKAEQGKVWYEAKVEKPKTLKTFYCLRNVMMLL